MANFYQGDIVRDYISLFDDLGVPITGASWVTLDTIDPDEEDFAITITEIGGGVYRIEFLANKVGNYYYLVETSGLSPDQVFTETITVDAATIGGAVVGTAAHGLNLNDLIQMCATQVGDFLWVQATANGSVDGSSLVDTLRLAAIPSQGLNGASITIVDPATSDNYLIERRVFLSEEETQTLTITPPFPAQVVSGETAWITNLESRGFWRQQYVNAINNAINLAFPMHLVPLDYSVPGTFSRSDPTIPAPSQLTHLYGVDYYEPATYQWRGMSLSPGNQPGPTGWWYDFSRGYVVVGSYDASYMDGRLFRLMGYGRPATLVDADDITTVNANWIVNRVAEALKMAKGDQRQLATASMFSNKAELYLGLNVTQVVPGTFKIK